MKLRYIITVLVAALTFLLTGCQPTEHFLSEVQVSQSTIAISKAGGQVEVTVTASDSWAISGDVPEWLSIDPLEGPRGETKVIFKAGPTEANNTALLYIDCAGVQQVLNIRQAEKVTDITSCAQVMAEQTVGKTYLVKGTVTDLTNYGKYGCFYVNDGTVEKDVYVYGSMNSDKFSPEVGDIITFEGPWTSYGNFDDVTILALEKSYIKIDEISPEDGNLPIEGGKFSVSLTCKGDEMTIVIPEKAKSWLTVEGVATSGTTSKITFAAAANTGGDRQVDLDFVTTHKEVEYKATTTLTQKGSVITFEEFIALDADASCTLEGIVTGIHKKGYVITDENHVSLYVYEDGDEAPAVKIGDKLEVAGKKGGYNKFFQVQNPTYKVLSEGNEYKYPKATECTDELWATLSASETDNAALYVSVTGVPSGDYGNIAFGEAENSVSPYQTSASFNYPAGFEGKTVTLKGYVMQVSTKYGNELRVIPVSIEEAVADADAEPEGPFIDEAFATSIGTFTIEDKTLPEGSTYVWKHDTERKYMKASSFIGGAAKASESWLVSPEVDLTGVKSALVLSFDQILNYLNGKAVADHVALMVKKGADDWAVVAWPETVGENFGKGWDQYTTTFDFSAYKGSKIKIAFKYVSTAECAPTWEVLNVKLDYKAE